MPQCVMDGEWEFVQLEPFVHQVGGHTTVLRYSDSTVCKTLIPREHQFYKTMPHEMKEFTPQYRGVIEVTFHEDSDGFISLVGRPPSRPRSNSLSLSKKHEDASSTCVSSAATSSSSQPEEKPTVRSSHGRSGRESGVGRGHRFRLRRSGSVEIDGIPRCSSDTALDGDDDDDDDDDDYEPDVSSLNHNTWSLRCHKEQLARMLTSDQAGASNKFILLENLTWKMEMPCILDLKMGTRQHGDDATEEKRQSQMSKCRTTTSSNLGIRICGMQVYRVSTGKYTCHNKYYGRRLDIDGVRDTLRQFLADGYRYRSELIAPIVERLRKLLDMLSKQSTFRFYSSSLLIMYDGGSGRKSSPSSLCSDAAAAASGGLPAERSLNVPGLSSRGSFHEPAAASSSSHLHVDVRMIDFAHATHHGFLQDKTDHVGPDHGYLFGLKNLIGLFENDLFSSDGSHASVETNDNASAAVH